MKGKMARLLILVLNESVETHYLLSLLKKSCLLDFFVCPPLTFCKTYVPGVQDHPRNSMVPFHCDIEAQEREKLFSKNPNASTEAT